VCECVYNMSVYGEYLKKQPNKMVKWIFYDKELLYNLNNTIIDNNIVLCGATDTLHIILWK